MMIVHYFTALPSWIGQLLAIVAQIIDYDHIISNVPFDVIKSFADLMNLLQ